MDQLSLFENEGYNFSEELLDFEADFLTQKEADDLFHLLLKEVSWQQTSKTMYDRTVLTPRLTAWYDDENTSYQLAGKAIAVNQWLEHLEALKEKIEQRFNYRFNSVLINLYRDNSDSVAWHRDRDSELGDRPVVGSISLGQARFFDFRKVDDHSKKYSLLLNNGSLLLMKGDLQETWEHRVAKSTQKMKARINLTFRLIGDVY
ncbi:alpha-ketoglutarate-dependent dioxygenase AlkB [Sphingobacterium sp. 2149]|uniref:alpha-ketoglutarate-dependent dioxygenase AlkB family protein n=1 Tax=Sphingobacterium sp. 2149 TaxID=2817763 RepID=UPI001AE93157|nr:alpha-ketoglutarate-dependent dioxygenase AlkB [Sphingobacterium sp. 2149]MDR6736236.1 alkylated DNA repair dioxygenase AlkB [Sphingobacterium sp. 2149]